MVGTFVKALHRTDGTKAFDAQEQDAFVLQLDRAGDTVGLRTWGGRANDDALGVAWHPSAGLAVVGNFTHEHATVVYTECGAPCFGNACD